MSRGGKAVETESSLVVSRDGGKDNGETLLNASSFLERDKSVLSPDRSGGYVTL